MTKFLPFFILLSSTLLAQTTFRSAGLELTLDARAQVTRLSDPKSGVNYVPQGQAGTLIRVRTTDQRELAPASIKVRKNTLLLQYGEGIELQVGVKEQTSHLRFELLKVQNSAAVDAILWGPFHTTIGDTIGEVVGVVRNHTYAMGIQALNPQTVGGKWISEDGSSPSFAGITGTAATPEAFGSALQAFCVNYANTRRLSYQQCVNCEVPPIPGYTLEGSAIALFGAPTTDALATLEKISVKEGLPHQTIQQDWIRRSPRRNRPYLITSFNETNFDEMLELTKQLGFHCIYHEHPFENWGQFNLLENQFPNGRAGLKACVDKARAAGIIVGVHTLTNFITTNDPFVTTEANQGLQDLGSSFLSADIDTSSTEIPIDDPEHFELNTTLNAVLIGNEIIRYQSVSEEKPYRLLQCVRGEYDTQAGAYPRGAKVRRLADHGYRTFFPGWAMQAQMIRNLADLFNETGVAQLDFDGHEGALATGYGDYGTNYFVDAFIKQVKHPVYNGSSIMNHYYWHNNSYINWGEPWYASFRESQADHRFRLQPFFERNYMPNMLGWFLVTTGTAVEDVEWMMAVSAGYHAGYALVLGYDAYQQNPDIKRIIHTIALWEEAKKRRIFSPEQRSLLKNPGLDFHLEQLSDSVWMLQHFDKFNFEHQPKTVQPGEPNSSTWTFEQLISEQPIHLRLTASGEGALIKQPELEFDGFFRVKIPATLKAGESLVWDGVSPIKRYNEKGKLLETYPQKNSLPPLKPGTHRIVVVAGAMEGTLHGVVKRAGKQERIRVANR